MALNQRAYQRRDFCFANRQVQLSTGLVPIVRRLESRISAKCNAPGRWSLKFRREAVRGAGAWNVIVVSLLELPRFREHDVPTKAGQLHGASLR